MHKLIHAAEETLVAAAARSSRHEGPSSPDIFVAEDLALKRGAEPVPGYRLVARIGRGGSGEVWKARGPGGFLLAFKFIPLGDAEAAVELRSLELLRDIRHANLVTVFGTWQRHGALIVAMELADGSLLDRYREATRAGAPGIPKAELIESLGEAAKAIDYLNEPHHRLPGRDRVGVQHRDIKPHNLLRFGGSVKVADFGLAQVVGDHLPTDTVQATPAYAAPECFHGQTSSRSDQYSLAVTYCQLRGGRLPFTGSIWQVMLGHSLDVPPLDMLPPEDRPVVARALAKNPEDRWPDCRTFVQALASGVSSPQRRTRPHQRRAALVALAVLAGLLVCPGLPERSRDAGHAATTASILTNPVTPGEKIRVVTRESELSVQPIPWQDRIVDSLERGIALLAPRSGQTTAMRPGGDDGGSESWDELLAPEIKRNRDLSSPSEASPTGTESALVWKIRGEDAARKGDHDGAIADYSEALRIDPSRADIQGERGHAYEWTGDHDRAIADYTAALRTNRSAEVYYGRGLAFYNQGAFPQALADFSEALRLVPGYARAHNGRGLVFVARGESEKARADFTAALQADPTYAEAYNNRGCVYCQHGNWEKATADFTEAVRLDEKNASYARNRAAALRGKASALAIVGIPSS